MHFNLWLDKLHRVLENIEVTSNDGELEWEVAFMDLLYKTEEIKNRHGQIFLIGNGASSAMASHIAADLCKNAHISTRCFSDAALLTALANDCGVEFMFADPIRRQGNANDMLVCISSSGESPNIIQAVKQARELGMLVVTLSGMKPGNNLRRMGDLNFYAPAETYGFAETAHAAILHYWVDNVVPH